MNVNSEKPPYKSIEEAIENQDLPAIKYFIEVEKVDPNYEIDSEYNVTLLLYASIFSNTEIIKYLVSKGADPYARDTFYNALPLHFSCLFGMVDNVKYFIIDLKIDPNERAVFHETALHFSVHNPEDSKDIEIENAKFEIVKFLIENTKIDVKAKDVLDKSALDYALIEQYEKIADYLRSHMANWFLNLKDLKNRNSKSSNEKETNSRQIDSQMVVPKLYSSEQSYSRIEHQNPNSNSAVQDVDLKNTLILFNVLVRMFTNKKFICNYQESSLIDAKANALNIIDSFEKILKKISMQFDISIDGFEPTKLISSLTWHLRNGKLKEISGILISEFKNNCPELRDNNELLNQLNNQLEINIKKILMMKELKPMWLKKIKLTDLSNDLKSIFNKLQIQSGQQFDDTAKIEKLI